MNNSYMAIVYLHPNVSIQRVNNFSSMIANNTIKKNSLLLIEHVFTGSIDQCHFLVQENEYLYNELHPRNQKWSEMTNNAAKEIIAKKKVSANGFMHSATEVILGDTVSKFNHSCTPNSLCFKAGESKINGFVFNYIGVFACKDVSEGEELKINYGGIRGHNGEDDFHCNCGLTTAERNRLEKKTSNQITDFIKQISLRPVISQYEKIANYQILCQYLAISGLVISNETNYNLTNKLLLTFNKFYGSINLDEKKNQFIDHIQNVLFSPKLK